MMPLLQPKSCLVAVNAKTTFWELLNRESELIAGSFEAPNRFQIEDVPRFSDVAS